MKPDELRRYLEFYQDLGFKSVYRREGVARAEVEAQLEVEAESESESESERGSSAERGSAPQGMELEDVKKKPVVEEAPAPKLDGLPSLAPEGDTLLKIVEDMGDCTRCRLHEKRNKIVFGVGNEKSPLVFVGEGPGADEDEQGIPFVGRAGQLLTQMIENTAKGEGIPILRKDIYICNVVKCRPPGNRNPEKDEMEVCGQFLFRQLMAIKPKAIVALGGIASKALLNKREGVTKLRGNWHHWNDIQVMVTFHPSYLLRSYNKDAKRLAWEDLKKAFHYVYD